MSWPPKPRVLRGSQDLRDAVAGAPVLGGEEAAQYWRKSFDGDTRALGGLDGPPSVAAFGGGRAGPGPGVKLSAPRRNTLAVNDPSAPSAAAVPVANLPSSKPGDGPRGGGPTLSLFDAFQKKVYSYSVPLLSRLGWNAGKRRGHDVRHSPYHVTVHHTQGVMTMSEAETAAAVRGIQRYHMVGRAREGKEAFEDIGYHFLIDGSGRIVEGRHAEVLGAHAGESNDGNIGIALMGDFNKLQPTEAQIVSLRRLVSFWPSSTARIRCRRFPGGPPPLQPHRLPERTSSPSSGTAPTSTRDRPDRQAPRRDGRRLE